MSYLGRVIVEVTQRKLFLKLCTRIKGRWDDL